MKRVIFCMALCLILNLTGCAESNYENLEPLAIPITTPLSTMSSTPQTISESEMEPTVTESITEPVETIVPSISSGKVDLSGIQGKISGIYSVGDGKLLVFAEKLTLYNLIDGTIIASTENKGLRQIHVSILDSGYAICGQMAIENAGTGLSQGGSGPQFYAAIYDENLLLQSEINMSEIVSEGEFILNSEVIAISPDSKSLAYATMQGISLYNLQTESETRVIDLNSQNEGSALALSTIEQIVFTNSGKTIAFKGQSLEVPLVDGKPSIDTFGTVNIDESDFLNVKVDAYATKVLTGYDSRLMVSEDFTSFSGHMMVKDMISGKQNIYTLIDNKEGGNIYGSDLGGYFASSVADKTGWTIRVYDASTGNLVMEESISNDGQEQYGMKDPMMCVNDDTKTCIVLLGNKQDRISTKVVTFTFD